MGFIDLANVSEENICDVKYRLKNITVKPNNPENHSINVEVELEICCKVFEDKKISIIQDMYSPSRNLQFKENKVSTITNMKYTTDTINIRDKIELEDKEYTKILDVQATPVINDTEIINNRLKGSGDINLKFLLTNDVEDNIVLLNKQIPFEFMKEIDGINEESKIEIEIIPMSKEFILDGMDAIVKMNLCINANSYNLEIVNVIDEIEETDDEDINPYSMIIYFVKEGDTLWKIAKKYKSTVDDIVRVNNIENPDKIDVGMQLFIPKYSICRTKTSA